ncbi:hypothetical protein QE152_g6244 [Popillia japonica]|uniref:Uncharacterized protein n=1 Tax=Popillia japonica TaxID=7064 RepID=A0AAW1MFE1_POPJA
MNEITYRGLSFQCWLLIGIVSYVLAVLMIIYARYCLLKRTFCPFSNCCIHCTRESKCYCQRMICQLCRMEPILSKPMCCRQNHLVNEPDGCFYFLSSIRCQCFSPTCTYCYCLCCEVSIENEYRATKQLL